MAVTKNDIWMVLGVGMGGKGLLAELGAQLRPVREFVELSIPHERAAVIARLHAVAQVLERDYEGATARFKARIPPHLHEEFAAFIKAKLNGVGTKKPKAARKKKAPASRP